MAPSSSSSFAASWLAALCFVGVLFLFLWQLVDKLRFMLDSCRATHRLVDNEIVFLDQGFDVPRHQQVLDDSQLVFCRYTSSLFFVQMAEFSSFMVSIYLEVIVLRMSCWSLSYSLVGVSCENFLDGVERSGVSARCQSEWTRRTCWCGGEFCLGTSQWC